MKHSPLHEDHKKLGAVFTEQHGWEVPDHYGNAVADHLAVRKGVGMMDLSARGKARVTGEDRVKWLQSVISNDILPLEPGQGVHSTFLSHKGKILAYFRVYKYADSLLLEDIGEVGETSYSALRKFLLYGTKAKLEDLRETSGILLISGHRAFELIRAAFGTDVSSLELLSFEQLDIEGHPAALIRTEETGEIDVEILLPMESLRPAWERLWSVGQEMGVKAFGATALESLRVEAGLPKMGPDLNENVVPPEANLEGKSFSLTKGCYPGQEVVARMDTYGAVRRRLTGLTLKDAVVPPAGAKLFSGDREIGWISSAVLSPSLQKVIALAFPLRDYAKPGTELSVETDGRRISATVETLPFVKSS